MSRSSRCSTGWAVAKIGRPSIVPAPDIVDPEIDVVRIYGQAGERFASPVELSRDNGDVLTTPLLPGLELPLARIFRE